MTMKRILFLAMCIAHVAPNIYTNNENNNDNTPNQTEQVKHHIDQSHSTLNSSNNQAANENNNGIQSNEQPSTIDAFKNLGSAFKQAGIKVWDDIKTAANTVASGYNYISNTAKNAYDQYNTYANSGLDYIKPYATKETALGFGVGSAVAIIGYKLYQASNKKQENATIDQLMTANTLEDIDQIRYVSTDNAKIEQLINNLNTRISTLRQKVAPQQSNQNNNQKPIIINQNNNSISSQSTPSNNNTNTNTSNIASVINTHFNFYTEFSFPQNYQIGYETCEQVNHKLRELRHWFSKNQHKLPQTLQQTSNNIITNIDTVINAIHETNEYKTHEKEHELHFMTRWKRWYTRKNNELQSATNGWISYPRIAKTIGLAAFGAERWYQYNTHCQS